MSYKKAMKHHRNIRKCRKQARMHFGFSTLGRHQRRKDPWFGSWVLTATKEQLKAAVDKYHAETVRMLENDPELVLV